MREYILWAALQVDNDKVATIIAQALHKQAAPEVSILLILYTS